MTTYQGRALRASPAPRDRRRPAAARAGDDGRHRPGDPAGAGAVGRAAPAVRGRARHPGRGHALPRRRARGRDRRAGGGAGPVGARPGARAPAPAAPTRASSGPRSRRFPRGLDVRIHERVPVLLVRHGEPWEIDSCGVLLEPLAAGVMADVPMLTGPDISALPAGAQMSAPRCSARSRGCGRSRDERCGWRGRCRRWT